MRASLRVLLVDDHPVVRVGVRLALEETGKYTIAGEAGDVPSAHRLVEELQPDLVVLDLFIGGRDGPELIEDLLVLHPTALILIFTSTPETDYARRTLRAGAHGYITKSAGLEAVKAAAEKVARGEYAYSATVQQALMAEAATGRRPADVTAGLSNRELQIFRLLGAGLGTADIARELHLGVKTVGTYRERLKSKLNLGSARELEQMAQNHARPGAAAPLR